MRERTKYFIIIGLIILIAVTVIFQQFQIQSIEEPDGSLLNFRVGYALQANVTGGEGQPLYIVRNARNDGPGSLRDALSTGDRYIVFHSNLEGKTIYLNKNIVNQQNNITLDGRGVKFYISGGAIKFEGTNVVIAGLHFRENELDVETDALTFRNAPAGGQRFFVYGTTFESASDGLLDIIWNHGEEVYGTVRRCRFERHNKAILIDSNHDTFEGGRYYVTFNENYFLNLIQRMPLARHAKVHLYNNVIQEFGGPNLEGGGARAGAETEIIFEHNVIVPYRAGMEHWTGSYIASPALKSVGPHPTTQSAIVKTESNLLFGGAFEQESRPEEVSKIPYLYVFKPASLEMARVIRSEAGDTGYK